MIVKESRKSLSVILCNYNDSHFLQKSLPALLGQSLKPKEIIIVDDGSTDDSLEVIKKIAASDPILRLIHFPENRGGIVAGKYALGLTSGDYLFSGSADDMVLPGFFEKSMSILEDYPEAGLCCSHLGMWEPNGTIKKDGGKESWSDEPHYFKPEELSETYRRSRWRQIDSRTCIIKRSALMEFGGFREDLKWHCDWFAVNVIALRYGICYVPETLVAMNMRQNSYSSLGMNHWPSQQEVLNNILRLLRSEPYSDLFPLCQKAQIMNSFGSQIARTILTNPKHWDLASLKLAQRAIKYELLNSLLYPYRLVRRAFHKLSQVIRTQTKCTKPL